MTPNTMRLGRRDARTRYVVGFAFNQYRDRLALIMKHREPPGSDMRGTLNGIGGACEPRESYHSAMVREFKQEAGVIISPWDLFAIVEGDAWRMHCFTVDCDAEEWRKIKTLGKSETDEYVSKVTTRSVLLDHRPRRPSGNVPATAWTYPDVPALVQLALTDLYERRAIHIDRREL